MARPPHLPRELRRKPFVGSKAIDDGLITYHQLRGKSWRQLGRDIYVATDLEDSHALRCQVVGLVLPAGAAITGRSAACLYGLPLGELHDPVHVLAPLRTRFRRPGCRFVRTNWLPEGHIRLGDPPVTVRTRTAWEIASEPDLIEAVVALDVMFRARKPRREAMDPWVARFPDSPGARAITLSDWRAESPQETRARVRLTLAGFPPPTPQYQLKVRGRNVARVDLAWPGARVAVEYDGIWHGERQQVPKDRARLNRIADAGWRVLHLTVADLEDPLRFDLFCGQLRRALGIQS